MVLLVVDKGAELDRTSGQKSPWDTVPTLKKRLDRRRNEGAESRIHSLQLCSKSARCLTGDLITMDEHVIYQGVELHFYFTLLKSWPTCQSASLFGRGMHLHPNLCTIYQIAFVTVNMFSLATNGGSDAAATAALAEENSRLQLGTSRRVVHVWLHSLIV